MPKYKTIAFQSKVFVYHHYPESRTFNNSNETPIMIRHFFLLLIGASLIGCGFGTGRKEGFDKRVFSVSKQTLARAIDSLFDEHREYKIPEKWVGQYNWKEENDFEYSHIFYLQAKPEEMYYVSFVGNQKDSVQNSIAATIVIKMVCDGSEWQNGKNISRSENTRIEKRFDDEIITKLEQYTNSKVLCHP